MIIVNSTLRASLTYNRLISKVHSRNEMLPELSLKQANEEWSLTSRQACFSLFFKLGIISINNNSWIQLSYNLKNYADVGSCYPPLRKIP